AIHTLKIKHIIVCGHYGCGGVRAALDNSSHGLIDNWLTKIRHTYARHQGEIDALPTREARVDRLCELNVVDQVRSVSQTTIVQEAWARGQTVNIYGWCYWLKNGLVNDLGVKVSSLDEVPPAYRVV
ncbi:MAG TPA: carbonic anhydrase, partial [Chthoniobacterales bacterium]